MKITVGVPVYNGGSMLLEALNCLQSQTFLDFHVLIYDNASTDDTARIARLFCEKNSKFTYYCQPKNKGPAQNFIDVLEAANSPFFMWRAHDDSSDENYLERLFHCFEREPHAILAASRIEQIKISTEGKKKFRTIPYRLLSGGAEMSDLAPNLRTMHQSWFYGLWRTNEIKSIWSRIYDRYPYAWASDFLMLYAALMQKGITGTNETTFRQKIISKSSQHNSQAAPVTAHDLTERQQLFYEICCDEINLSARPFVARARLRHLLKKFTYKRVGSQRRKLQLMLKGYTS